MGYLNYENDDLDVNYNPDGEEMYMRQTEIDHMVDVKNLYTGLRIIALGSLIIGVSLVCYQYKRDKKELYITLKTMPYFPIGFIVIVGGAMAIDFSATFTIFHKIFFTNDDWLLRYDDILILLLPQSFWMISGVLILIGFSATIGLIYYLNDRLLRNT